MDPGSPSSDSGSSFGSTSRLLSRQSWTTPSSCLSRMNFGMLSPMATSFDRRPIWATRATSPEFANVARRLLRLVLRVFIDSRSPMWDSSDRSTDPHSHHGRGAREAIPVSHRNQAHIRQSWLSDDQIPSKTLTLETLRRETGICSSLFGWVLSVRIPLPLYPTLRTRSRFTR